MPPMQQLVKKSLKSSPTKLKTVGKSSIISLRKEDLIEQETETWIKGRNLIIPEDQLELTEKELQEELARVLTTVNPSRELSRIEWSFREKTFVPSRAPPHHISMLDFAGTSLHKESPEALLQIELENLEEEPQVKIKKPPKEANPEENEEDSQFSNWK